MNVLPDFFEADRGALLLIRESLQDHQIEHQPFVVQDGRDAIERQEHSRELNEVPCPDLTLLDFHRPKGGGSAVLRDFRKRSE